MAKATRMFVGSDTYGRAVERALRVDGLWFARYVHSTNYGLCFCKWYQDEPSFETETENAYSGEITKHEPIPMWGFNRMQELDAPFHIRLPKV